ncbi:class II glutamine amidotransferase [Nocardia otitidiscaviarum]|uniref:class II glutamine amidotransferase n=1 Tax=Nocardia otitidiscaviarum TaxID=1823 RepID=UPI0004A77A49|nr:class II glutamine amidotransferase [Nocardia otitidiscaviarum]MBF6133441.1 class II glutamine amidotransferase [Nocardia otitidiscaviarum]MBF6486837.1 class II glutamine amidotransferase [Nocardia otitidiscaviarum]
MCRLFGLSAAPQRVKATFWLLDAPDSLARQSRREPDGVGLGTFAADGTPLVEKQPLAAYEDARFGREARERASATFVAHVRYASTGAVEPRNTHPFQQFKRLFAHNGVLHGLSELDAELGAYRELVQGDTDSERFFALITKRIDKYDGDVTAGIADAVAWIADRLPVYALNLVLTTATELWALRYPATHELYVLERAAGGAGGDRHLDHAGRIGIRARSGHLARHPAVVVASERVDEDPGWRLLRPGELLHVDELLGVRSTRVLNRPPRHPLSLAQLEPAAAASQTGA